MLLVEVTIASTVYYVSTDALAIEHFYDPYIASFTPPQLRISAVHGGHATFKFGEVVFSPDLFAGNWPPPQTCSITCKYTATNEAAAVTFFSGVLYLAGFDRTSVTYDFFGDAIDNPVVNPEVKLSSMTYDGTVADGQIGGMHFTTDGTVCMMAGIVMFELSSGWDITSMTETASIPTMSPVASYQVSYISEGGTFGVYMAVDDTVRAITYSTAFDMSTGLAHATNYCDVSGTILETAVDSGFYNPSHFYLCNNATIYQWDLSTANDLTSASYNQSETVTELTSSTIRAIWFSSDGLFMMLQDYTKVHRYKLSTAWDISTAVHQEYYDFSGVISVSSAMAFDPDMLNCYFSYYWGGTGVSYQYTLSYNLIGTLNEIFTELCNIMGLTLNTTYARTPSPTLVSYPFLDQLALKVCDDLAKAYSHCFYISGSTLYLVDMFADNGSRTLTEAGFYPPQYYMQPPIASLISDNDVTQVVVNSSYPYGSVATYNELGTGDISTHMSNIITINNKNRAKVRLPISATVPKIGEKITWTDTALGESTSMYIRARGIQFDFINDEMVIDGEGVAS